MSRTRAIVIFLVASFVAGCSSKPERIAITGSVSLDSKPLDGCAIVFQPLESDSISKGATAIVSDGKFEVSEADGLAAGVYGVVFTEIQPDLEDYEANRNASGKNGLKRKIIPAKYTTANELRVPVSAGMAPVELVIKSR